MSTPRYMYSEEVPLGRTALGPFDPPADYAFEPELRGDVPRPIPNELREGRYGRGQRRLVVGLIAATVVCLAASVVPIVQFWGQFLLPLAYISWIGAAFALAALVAWLRQRFAKGPYLYVESGTPLVARVCARNCVRRRS